MKVDRIEGLKGRVEIVSEVRKREIQIFVYANNHYAGFAPALVERKLTATQRPNCARLSSAVEMNLDPRIGPDDSPRGTAGWSQRLLQSSDQKGSWAQRALEPDDLQPQASFAECVFGRNSIRTSYSPEKPIYATTAFSIFSEKSQLA